MTGRAAAVLAVLCAIFMAGCGSEDEKPDPKSKDAIAEELAAVFANGSDDYAAYADCFGEKLAASRSADDLRDDGLLTEDYQAAESRPVLDREAAVAYVDAWVACVDYVKVSGVSQKKVTPTLDVAAYEKCLARVVTPALFRTTAIDLMMGKSGSAAVRKFSKAQFDCAKKHK